MDANAAPRPDPAAERAARMMIGLEWVMVPVVLALGFMLASFAVRNSEFWMHLATGRLIAEGKYEFGKDPYSFATEGRTWVNHSWLYDLLLYKAYDLNPDHSAVVYIKAALVAVMALVMLMACRPSPDQAIVPGTKANPTGWIAAIAVSLALIAMGPRLILTPTIVSYLFTAVTLFVLLNSPRWPAYALPVSLGVLFALWVNMDQWFFIGPTLVALFLLGEWLQQYVPGAERRPDPARLKLLAIALAVGLAACLINPHHVRAFSSLPSELVPNVSEVMQKDKSWRSQFISTTNILYTSRPEYGYSIPGFSYWAVMALGLLGFGLNYRSLRADQILVWAAAAALPLAFNHRLVPFFVIVGAPIAVLNIHAFFANLPGRKRAFAVPGEVPGDVSGEPPSAPSPESITTTPANAPPPVPASQQAITAATPAGKAEGWWPGASEEAPVPSMAPAARASAGGAFGGELQLTPETMMAMGGVMGRLLTVVVGVAAVVACWPGWLNAMPGRSQRRVEWALRPDPAYVQIAEKLNQWRQSGHLPADARGMALDLDLTNYCAWYAPGVRGFMDYRFALLGDLSRDLMQVKRGLTERATETAEPIDYTGPLRAHKANYLVLNTDNDPAGRQLLAQLLVFEQDEWVLWYHNGRIGVFGWHDLAQELPADKDPLKMDLVAMALGPTAERVPPGDTFGVTREPAPESRPEPTLIDRFLTPPPPERPTESISALLYWATRDLAYRRAQAEGRIALNPAFAAAWIGLSAQHNLMTPFSSPTNQALMQTAQRMALAHPLPVSVGVLAVREARRGALAHPNDGYPSLALGMAYNVLPPVGPELRRIEQLTALHQAVDRIRPDEIDSGTGAMLTTAWLGLYELHMRYGERDLAEESLDNALKQYDKYPPLLMNIPPEQQEKYHEYLQRQSDQLKTELLAARDNYKLAQDQAKRRNARPAEQTALALQYGLVREALKIIEDPANSSKPDPLLLQQGVAIYLALGRVELAQQVLNQVPEELRENFHRLQVNTWMGAGEYARAGKGLEEMIAAFDRADDPKRKFIQAAKVFQLLHFSVIEPSAWGTLVANVPWGLLEYSDAATGLELTRRRKAELLAMRAMVALEEGDIPTATKYFHDATEMRVAFDGLQYAAIYRRALERAAGK
jgi:tetratricopeptide (TPR) repeat protein